MPLEPVITEPGLWINTDLRADSAGVHALIIGVSRYDHLDGGSAPAPKTYGLGQLSVSALTAYRFFSWLRNGYTLDGWPIARVRLLMSPLRRGLGTATADELQACDELFRAHAPEATFDNCKGAIENWYADMEALQAPAAGRSLFLFSGHGMERRQNYQVLLPSDYLKPPGRLINNAISTPNLVDALSYLARVPSHVLLLDGCRNDVDDLRGATGANILNDEQAIAVNPMFEKGVLYATASGLRAYSPRSDGLSLFGQALLDGLSNNPIPILDEAPIELLHKHHVSTVEINKLASYMKGRVAALIKAARESVVQVVRSEVASSDPGRPIELTEIPLASNANRGEVAGFSIDSTRGPPAGLGSSPDAWFRERYRAAKIATAAPPGASRQQHINRLHEIFGSEAVTFPWLDKLQIIGMSSHQSSDHRAIEILSSAQAVKTAQLHRLQVVLRVTAHDPVGHLMVIESERGRRFCCVLPMDIDQRIFQLEIDVEGSDYLNFAVYLSPQNDGPTGRIAAAWEQLRARDPLAAAQGLEASHTTEDLAQAFRDGEDTLRLKVRAPLAAAVATVLLLKGNQFHRMHDWARNLANWFPTIPDGVVLWTEQCRRVAAGSPLHPDLVSWFVRELSQRSLPFTADGFGLASDLVNNIVRGRLEADDATRTVAGALARRLDAAAPYFRDTGLFCTFAGFSAEWNPALMLGPPVLPCEPDDGRRSPQQRRTR